MKINLQRIPVNLQQSIIWSQQPEVINTICAITHKRRNLLVIMAGFQSIQDDIIAACGLDSPAILYGDHFNVDTWDNRVETYLKACVVEEELQTVIDEADVVIDAWERDKIVEGVGLYMAKKD